MGTRQLAVVVSLIPIWFKTRLSFRDVNTILIKKSGMLGLNRLLAIKRYQASEEGN